MGGSSGGGFSPIDIESIREAANKRLQSAFDASRPTLFVCQAEDSDELVRRINQTAAFSDRNWVVITEGERARLRKELEVSGLVIAYAGASKTNSLINEAITIGSELRKQMLFVKGQETTAVPNYVLQFRVRVLSWSQLIEILF